jgi:hypothetical protein
MDADGAVAEHQDDPGGRGEDGDEEMDGRAVKAVALRSPAFRDGIRSESKSETRLVTSAAMY